MQRSRKRTHRIASSANACKREDESTENQGCSLQSRLPRSTAPAVLHRVKRLQRSPASCRCVDEKAEELAGRMELRFVDLAQDARLRSLCAHFEHLAGTCSVRKWRSSKQMQRNARICSRTQVLQVAPMCA